MAILESQGLRLTIGNVIQYNMEDGETDVYENFDISLTLNGERAIHQEAFHESYELCSGNIQSLILTIEEAMEKKDETHEIEFLEPNFEFTVKCVLDKETSEVSKHFEVKDSLYELVVWATSGNWKSPYGGTSLGGKFMVYENELRIFLNEIKDEYANRKIEIYS